MNTWLSYQEESQKIGNTEFNGILLKLCQMNEVIKHMLRVLIVKQLL